MKIVLDYFDDERYRYAKDELLDPDMGLDELMIQVRFNDYGIEIVLDDIGSEIIKIDDARTYFGIYFNNGNCFEELHEHCIMTVRFFNGGVL